MKSSVKSVFPIAAISLGIISLYLSLSPSADSSEMKQAMQKPAEWQTATFAGGCFWCMEPPFEALNGVKEVISGYTGGDKANPTYKQVSAGMTKHLEAIQVLYDPQLVSYQQLLDVYWRQIDPTDAGGSFVDRGDQYRSAIFYHNDEQMKLAQTSKLQLDQSGIYPKAIVTEIRPAAAFYPAESYHQDYYKENPYRYKFYRYRSGRDQYLDKLWGEKRHAMASGKMLKVSDKSDKSMQYRKPGKAELRKRLTPLQYKVTQEEGTERPFDNAYWDNKQAGIYVDIVSGEPLFSSTDKFKSGTGWPSFTKPLTKDVIVEKQDRSLFMLRTEVRSKGADSHLGHVFNDGPAPTGKRYCINSASLRFVPVSKLQDENLGHLAKLFK